MKWAKIAEKIDKHTKALTSTQEDDGTEIVSFDTVVVNVFELKKDLHTTLDEYVRELLGEEEEVRTKPHRVEHWGISTIAFDAAVRNKFRKQLLATHQQNMKEEP